MISIAMTLNFIHFYRIAIKILRYLAWLYLRARVDFATGLLHARIRVVFTPVTKTSCYYCLHAYALMNGTNNVASFRFVSLFIYIRDCVIRFRSLRNRRISRERANSARGTFSHRFRNPAHDLRMHYCSVGIDVTSRNQRTLNTFRSPAKRIRK